MSGLTGIVPSLCDDDLSELLRLCVMMTCQNCFDSGSTMQRLDVFMSAVGASPCRSGCSTATISAITPPPPLACVLKPVVVGPADSDRRSHLHSGPPAPYAELSE
jgi:hypothetical protein